MGNDLTIPSVTCGNLRDVTPHNIDPRPGSPVCFIRRDTIDTSELWLENQKSGTGNKRPSSKSTGCTHWLGAAAGTKFAPETKSLPALQFQAPANPSPTAGTPTADTPPTNRYRRKSSQRPLSRPLTARKSELSDSTFISLYRLLDPRLVLPTVFEFPPSSDAPDGECGSRRDSQDSRRSANRDSELSRSNSNSTQEAADDDDSIESQVLTGRPVAQGGAPGQARSPDTDAMSALSPGRETVISALSYGASGLAFSAGRETVISTLSPGNTVISPLEPAFSPRNEVASPVSTLSALSPRGPDYQEYPQRNEADYLEYPQRNSVFQFPRRAEREKGMVDDTLVNLALKYSIAMAEEEAGPAISDVPKMEKPVREVKTRKVRLPGIPRCPKEGALAHPWMDGVEGAGGEEGEANGELAGASTQGDSDSESVEGSPIAKYDDVAEMFKLKRHVPKIPARGLRPSSARLRRLKPRYFGRKDLSPEESKSEELYAEHQLRNGLRLRSASSLSRHFKEPLGGQCPKNATGVVLKLEVQGRPPSSSLTGSPIKGQPASFSGSPIKGQPVWAFPLRHGTDSRSPPAVLGLRPKSPLSDLFSMESSSFRQQQPGRPRTPSAWGRYVKEPGSPEHGHVRTPSMLAHFLKEPAAAVPGERPWKSLPMRLDSPTASNMKIPPGALRLAAHDSGSHRQLAEQRLLRQMQRVQILNTKILKRPVGILKKPNTFSNYDPVTGTFQRKVTWNAPESRMTIVARNGPKVVTLPPPEEEVHSSPSKQRPGQVSLVRRAQSMDGLTTRRKLPFGNAIADIWDKVMMHRKYSAKEDADEEATGMEPELIRSLWGLRGASTTKKARSPSFMLQLHRPIISKRHFIHQHTAVPRTKRATM